MRTPYHELRGKIINEHLDRFPDAGSLTIAKIIFRDYPEWFPNVEHVRSLIRLRRGKCGKARLNQLKDKRYVK